MTAAKQGVLSPTWSQTPKTGLLLFIVITIKGICNCSMFCCMLLYVHSSFLIILMGKTELVALLKMSSCCLVIVVWLFHCGAMGLSAVCDSGIS